MTKEEAKKFGLHLLQGIMERNESYPVYANNVKQAIDALSESGSSEIPKDARIAAKQFYPQDCFDSQAVRELGIDCFVDGAKWQAEHQPLPEDTVLFNKGVEEGKRLMREEAVEADVISNAYPTTIQFRTFDNRFHHGDKVHIIVIPNTDEK